MNNTQTTTGTDASDTLEFTMSEARRMSARNAERRVFVTQTSRDSFNFHFNAYNPVCGPLVAVLLNGESVAN